MIWALILRFLIGYNIANWPHVPYFRQTTIILKSIRQMVLAILWDSQITITDPLWATISHFNIIWTTYEFRPDIFSGTSSIMIDITSYVSDYSFSGTSSGGSWTPIAELIRTDADVTIMFLAQGVIPYATPVRDPWFMATTPFKLEKKTGQNTFSFRIRQFASLVASTSFNYVLKPIPNVLLLPDHKRYRMCWQLYH